MGLSEIKLYEFLKQIESKPLHDFNKDIDKFSKIDDIYSENTTSTTISF